MRGVGEDSGESCSDASDAEEVDIKPLDDGSRKDLTSVFPELKPLSECKVEKTKHKLKYDEVNIIEKLIKRHGSPEDDDNVDKMFRDIKLNYLQWSKG